uniref:AIR synthase related protein, N-terminal domain n=1 Tax=Candidatus Kentrum sp. DK TaxID=2126562 RepID=A0A450TK38_9GAMM|nr:MAG: AIR synthase related protein, N-terminal domain [Candidatus Kentron sp. DK]VFJ68804.1 MAG: AIR synthase related protein, N-terminal domain [Candidatus Kentron sp. DK]
MHEFQLIGAFFSGKGARRDDVLLGVGDDAALLQVPAMEGKEPEIVTAMATLRPPPEVGPVYPGPDRLPEKETPEFLGRRALGMCLRHLKASGAVPAWATLALTLPEADEAWLRRFSASLGKIARRARVSLVGGDTTRGALSITVVVNGLRAGRPDS